MTKFARIQIPHSASGFSTERLDHYRWVEVNFCKLQKPTYVEDHIEALNFSKMGIGKAPLIGAADKDMTSVKKKASVWP